MAREIDKTFEFTGASDGQKTIRFGNFFARLMMYLFIFTFLLIPWSLIVFNINTGGNINTSGNENIIKIIIGILIWLIPPATIPYLMERSNRKWRRKMGLPVYKSVWKEAREFEEGIAKEKEQEAINERVAMEAKAYKKAGVNQNLDKSDLAYWFDLKEKGAISEEEYEVKKRELL